MERGKGALAGEAVLLLAASLVLYRMDLAMLVFPAPLLLFSIHGGRKAASLLVAAGFVLAVITDLVAVGVPSGRESMVFFLISMFIPLSLSAAGIIWLGTEGRGLLPRLFLTMAPALVFAAVLAVFIGTDRALLESIISLFQDAFAAMLSPVMSAVFPGLDVGFIAYVALLAAASLIFPVLLCGICAGCFIFESVLHSRESMWEEKVMRFEYPSNAVWGFIASWALVLLLRFVSVPMLLEIAALNLATVWAVIYAIEGFSVIFAHIRKRWEHVRSMTVLILLMVIGLFVPGINLIILIGLPLLGVFETFFDLKRIGAGNEDYS